MILRIVPRCILWCWILLFLMGIGGLLFLTPIMTGGVFAKKEQLSSCETHTSTGPEVIGVDDYLEDVKLISANDVWAVGREYNGSQTTTLILRRAGALWERVSSPNPGNFYNNLVALDGTDGNNIWAVGSVTPRAGDPSEPLVLYWNGVEWTHIPLDLGYPNMSLNDIDALSPTDVWAVGHYTPIGEPARPISLHWDGAIWSVVPVPVLSDDIMILQTVFGKSSIEVWAGGLYFDATGWRRAFLVRWDGASWTEFPTPYLQYDSWFNDIDGTAVNDLWVVGGTQAGSGQGVKTLAEHWDGSSWQVVWTPNPRIENDIYGIGVAASTRAFISGMSTNTIFQDYHTMMLGWSGQEWSTMQTPNPSTLHNELRETSALTIPDDPPSVMVSTVGYYKNTLGEYSYLILDARCQ